MQQAGTFLHSDLGQLLHQPQCFLEEKKLLKCLMWMMRARCLAGSDGNSAPVSFVQGYRHTPTFHSLAGQTQPSEVFLRSNLRPYTQSQDFSRNHIHPAAIRGHQQFILFDRKQLKA